MTKRDTATEQMRLLLRSREICIPDAIRADLLVALAELLSRAVTSLSAHTDMAVVNAGGSDENVEADR